MNKNNEIFQSPYSYLLSTVESAAGVTSVVSVEFSARVSTDGSTLMMFLDTTGAVSANASTVVSEAGSSEETASGTVSTGFSVEGASDCSAGTSGLLSEVSTGAPAGWDSVGASLNSVTGASADDSAGCSAGISVSCTEAGCSTGCAADSSGIGSVGFSCSTFSVEAPLFSSGLAGVLEDWVFGWVFGDSSFVAREDTTLFGACAGLEALGGLFASTFSCVLLAELAVGRIMRARNPSSTGLALPLLDRDCGRLLPECGGEVRGVALRTLEVVGVVARGLAALVPFFKVEGLRDRVDVVGVVVVFDLAD